MKKIIFIFLIFCLAITTVLAQITPDGTTTTTTDTVGGVTVIDIAAPDSNGLSNNTYSDFNISSSGVVFNNSDSAGDSLLAGSISANSNYTSGNSASLILHQVTGSNTSSLLGKAEVFGTEAGVIIANPNGISCDACGFINTNRVDLVTGTSNFLGTALTNFSINDTSNITVSGNGFVDDAVAGYLNLASRYLSINAQVKANNTLNVLAGNGTYSHVSIPFITTTVGNPVQHLIHIGSNGSLEAPNINTAAEERNDNYGFFNEGDISADNLFLSHFTVLFKNQGNINSNISLSLLSDSFSNSSGAMINSSGSATIIASNFFDNEGVVSGDDFTITAGKDFTNTGSINVVDSLSIKLSLGNNNFTNTGSIDAVNSLNVEFNSDRFEDNNFTNAGSINADTFSILVKTNLDYTNRGNITASSLNLNVDGNFSNNDENNNFIWGANNSLVVLGTADITTDNYTQSGVIDVTGALNISASGNFTNSIGGDISADSLGLTVGNLIQNDGTIITDDLNIGTGSNFANQGDITAYTSLTVNAGNLIQNDGTIDTDILTIDTDAIHNPGNITANTSLTITATNDVVSGGNIITDDLNIGTGSNFANQGDITAYTSLTVNAGNLIQNDGTIITDILTIDTDAIHNSGSITANTSLTITATNNVFSGGSIITNALNIGAGSNFANHGDIAAGDSLGITAGYTAINQGSIVSGSLDIITDDFFRNIAGGDISVDSLNITAGGKVTNIATINAGTLNIIANNDSSRTYDTTGFYVANRGNITATSLNIAAVDNFYNRGDITADTLDIEAKDIFLLNKEIDSFVGTYDGGNIYLTENSSFRADGGRIENYGNIDLGDNNLAITAFIFINHSDATIDADAATLNLNVNTFIDAGSITAAINQSN